MSVKELRKQLKGKTQNQALEVIAAAMKAPGADLDALSGLMDEVLGTQLTEEDPEKLGAWEASNRRVRAKED